LFILFYCFSGGLHSGGTVCLLHHHLQSLPLCHLPGDTVSYDFSAPALGAVRSTTTIPVHFLHLPPPPATCISSYHSHHILPAPFSVFHSWNFPLEVPAGGLHHLHRYHLGVRSTTISCLEDMICRFLPTSGIHVPFLFIPVLFYRAFRLFWRRAWNFWNFCSFIGGISVLGDFILPLPTVFVSTFTFLQILFILVCCTPLPPG